MAKNYINHIGTYNDNSKTLTINTTSTDLTSIVRSFMADDEETVQEVYETDSIIFTKKAKQEKKEALIIDALQKSIQGRKDKTRAFVHELQSWQKEAYIDAHYNAQVMYDELAKIIPLPFGYEVFKKHYNNTRY